MNRIRGVGIGNQNNSVYTFADMQKLHQQGFNVVRFMMKTDSGSAWDHTISPWGSAYTTDGDDATNEIQAALALPRASDAEPYTNQLLKAQSILDHAEAFGMKVILVANRVVGRQNFLLSTGAMAETVTFWDVVLQEFAGHPALLGCEMLNESQVWGEGNGGTYGDTGTWELWRDTWQVAILAKIREYWRGLVFIDPRHSHTSDTHFSMDLSYLDTVVPFDDPGVVYVQHLYWPLKYCQNTWTLADGYNYAGYDGITYGGEFIQMPVASGNFVNREEMYFYIQPLIDFKERTGAQIMVGEFGCVRWQLGVDAWYNDIIDIMEENDFHWCHHAQTRQRLNEYDGFNTNLDGTLGDGNGSPLLTGGQQRINKTCLKNKPFNRFG